jgi:hypothetical protein
MSEAKTPRTDALEAIVEQERADQAAMQSTPAEKLRIRFLDACRAKTEGEWWAVGHIEEIETERDELKAENIRITKLRDHDFEELAELAELKRQLAEGPVCGPCEHKRARAFLERQIAEGELILLEVVTEWLDNVDIGEDLQDFAKREAGAK